MLAGCGSSSSTPSSATTTPSSAATPGPSSSGADPVSIGRAFIDALARGDGTGAGAMENAAMLAAAPTGELDQLWQAFVAQYGAFEDVDAVTVETAFANATVALTVTVTSTGLVGGLHVAKVTAPFIGPASSPAAYVRPGSFTDSAVTVGSAPWALPGTLSMPNGTGPFPAVVLVQGSGPNDRDETIGPNKPLRDIAWGLASAGIAVLRYDRRTFVYPAALAAQLSSLTVRQETTDDALAAIALLRSTPKVEPGRVFLAEHSLGAYLAPRIAVQAPSELRGLVVLEAPSTPLPQLIVTQEQYLAGLQGSPSPSIEPQLATLRAQVTLAESPGLSPETPVSELPLGSRPPIGWTSAPTTR